MKYLMSVHFPLTLLISFATSHAHAAVAPTHLFLSRVGPCADARKMPIKISELSIMRHFYDFMLKGQLNITSNFTDGWDIKATMQKCPDIRNIDTCDHFRSFTVVRGGCTGEDSPGFEAYSMFFHYVSPRYLPARHAAALGGFQPWICQESSFQHVFRDASLRMHCPIQAGEYKIENYPFFTEDNYLAVAEAKISTSVFGYTVRLDGFSDSEQVMCVEAYLRLLYLRDHNWLDLEADATEAPDDEDDNTA